MPEAKKGADLRAVESGGRLRGRFKDDAAGAEPDAGALPACPLYFTGDQRRIWGQLSRQLAPGVLQSSDWLRFGQLVLRAAAERELVREWNAQGSPVYDPPKRAGARPILNPLYSALRGLQRDMAPMFAEFGMQPTARKNVKVPKAAAVNPLDKFLRPI